MFQWYGLFIGIAIVVGWSVAERIEPKVNRGAMWIIASGLLGARIYHVVESWEYYSQHLPQLVAVWNGGMSIWGAMIGGLLAVWAVYRKDTINVVGAIVTGLPLAQAIGRIGNGVNGEFVQKVWILPWWASEALLDLVLFAIIVGKTAKQKIAIYAIGYALIRWVLHPYRA